MTKGTAPLYCAATGTQGEIPLSATVQVGEL